VTSWAVWALDRQATLSGGATHLWYLVRQLIRAGVCDPLDTDGYILGMVFGELSFGVPFRWFGNEGLGIPRNDAAIDAAFDSMRKRLLADALRSDPGLLEREIWRIFEVPGRPSRQLGVPNERGWISALTTLSASGEIDRYRLHDAVLDALARDITAYQATWFASLWHALDPAPAERERNQARLLHLLGHPVPVVVQFSLDEMDALAAGGTLDAKGFSAEVDGVLLTMPVATARHALGLLDRIAVTQPSARTQALVATATGLLHASASVRAASARLIATRAVNGDTEVAAAIEANGGALTDREAGRLRAITA
jgi:hypothetical protein